MATGLTLYSDISARVPNLIEDSLAVARMSQKLLMTVTPLGATGLMTRDVNEYNAITWVSANEEDDTAAQQFSKDRITQITPTIYRARVDITDPRAQSDFDSEMANASMEFGQSAAFHVDQQIAAQFSSLTNSVGYAGTVITWRHVTTAHAIVANQGINEMAPVYCALHPYQWEVLLASNSVAAATVAVAPGFQNDMVRSPSFFVIPSFAGIIFIITNAISIDGSDDAYGAVYTSDALAVDTRKPFDIRPQRDESNELTELNSSMWYAASTYRPARGCAILSDAATPSV